MPEKKVILIQHSPHEHPSTFQRLFQVLGIPVKTIRIFEEGALSKLPNPKNILGIVSMGGPMSVHDDTEHSWINAECELIKRVIEDGAKPVIGVCLGAQLISKALGFCVEKNSLPEVGWFPIQLTRAGIKDPVLGPIGMCPIVFQWHEDTFEVPSGAELLASSPVCTNQAFRLGEHVYGFQFHPEVDQALIREWLGDDSIEHEISELSQRFGPATVQPRNMQIHLAPRTEFDNVRIVASLSTLFKNISKKEKSLVRVTKKASSRSRRKNVIEHTLFGYGHLVSRFEVGGETWVTYVDQQGRLWPMPER